MKEKDIKHLEFIFERMVYIHNENENFDYMTKFREIIEQLRQCNVSKESEQFYCTCSRAKGLDHDEEGTPYCISCQKEVRFFDGRD